MSSKKGPFQKESSLPITMFHLSYDYYISSSPHWLYLIVSLFIIISPTYHGTCSFLAEYFFMGASNTTPIDFLSGRPSWIGAEQLASSKSFQRHMAATWIQKRWVWNPWVLTFDSVKRGISKHKKNLETPCDSTGNPIWRGILSKWGYIFQFGHWNELPR